MRRTCPASWCTSTSKSSAGSGPAVGGSARPRECPGQGPARRPGRLRLRPRALDDHSSLAYSEVLPDKRKDTCSAFWTRARTFFAERAARPAPLRPHLPRSGGARHPDPAEPGPAGRAARLRQRPPAPGPAPRPVGGARRGRAPGHLGRCHRRAAANPSLGRHLPRPHGLPSRRPAAAHGRCGAPRADRHRDLPERAGAGDRQPSHRSDAGATGPAHLRLGRCTRPALPAGRRPTHRSHVVAPGQRPRPSKRSCGASSPTPRALRPIHAR